MIELDKALKIIRKHLLSPGKEKVSLADASGRFLAEELHAIANRTPLEQALEGALAGLEPVDVKADTIIAVLRDSREVDAS